MITAIRSAVLAILAILVGLGLVPESVQAIIEANVDTVIAGVLAAWAIVAGMRAAQEKGGTKT